MKFNELPPSWQKEVKRLRTSCAKYRSKLRQAETEVIQLRDANTGLDIPGS